MSRRASYRHAVAPLADVDCDCTDVEQRAETVSVCIVADLFDKTPEAVAADVLKFESKKATP